MSDSLLVLAAGVAVTSLIVGSVSLWLCFEGRRKIQQLSRHVSDRGREVSSLSDKQQALHRQLEAFQGRFEEVELRRTSLLDFSSESPALNLSRRGQVLRLHRRGDSPAGIASSLGVSEGEVRLTVTVQELILNKPERDFPQK